MVDDIGSWAKQNADKLEEIRARRPEQPKADDVTAWATERQENAAGVASALIGRVQRQNMTPDKAASVVQQSDDVQQLMGFDLSPDMMQGVSEGLTARIEQQTRRAQLMGATKLSGWVTDSPINAALAQRDLANLSGLEGAVAAASKGADRLVRGAPANLSSTLASNNLRTLESAAADRDLSLMEILEDETDNDDRNEVREAFALFSGEKGARNLINTVGRYLNSRAIGRQLDAGELRTAITDQRGFLGETEATAQKVTDEIERRWGSAAVKTEIDERVGQISGSDGTNVEKLEAFRDLVFERPGAVGAWLGYVVLENAPSLVAAAGVGLITRNPNLAAAVLGATSMAVSRDLTYQRLLEESGYDLSDPEQRKALVESPEVRMQLRDKAFTYGLVVGLLDAASGSLAGTTLAKSPAGDMILQGLAQGVMGASGEYLGMLASGQDADIIEVLVEGLAELVTAPLEVLGVGGRKLGQARRVQQDRKFFKALADTAENSELRAKSPKKYRELLSKLTAEGPVETLYVDAKELDELFQSAPGETTAEQFLGAIPGVDVTAYRQARENGGLVEIPTASYGSDVVGTRFDELVRDHLKTNPDHMSAAEARAYKEQLSELTAMADAAAERAESGQAELERATETARVELVSALRRAGRTTDVAEKEALQAVAVARTTAQRLGVTLDEFLAEFPLADVQSALASGENQDPVIVTRETVERARGEPGEADSAAVLAIREAAEIEGLNLTNATPQDMERAVERAYGPGASGVLLNQPPREGEVQGSELRGDGRKFTGFFADVTQGTRQQPVRLDAYEPTVDLPAAVKRFADERTPYSGNFEDHIKTSIPGYREMQDATGFAIASVIGDGVLLDIGGSEGAMAKAVVARNPDARAVVADPNTAMQQTFESKPQVDGVTYDLSAFGAKADEGKIAWTEDDGTDIPFFDPAGERFDIVHEAMVFQFIADAREAQVARVKELLAEGGLFLTFEKFATYPETFARNEAQKDAYKAQYYDADELAAKAKEVLQNGGDAVEGMTALQVDIADMERFLTENFRVVVQIWDSGNFKGFAASDDFAKVNKFLDALPPLDSEFSTVETPRRVYKEDVPQKHPLPVNDDGTITLVHWSSAPRETLRVDKAGTGPTRGPERRRSGPKMLYFGIGVGQPGGYVKDVQGNVRHEVDVPLTDLYDFTADPDRLKMQIPADVPNLQRMGWLEERMKDAGHKGFFVREGPLGMTAAMFEDVVPQRTWTDGGVTLYQSGASPDFFSALTREVANAKQKAAPANNWKAIIQKLPGIKKAEIEWSGVLEWLDTREGNVAREDVAEFLRDNELKVTTVVRSGEGEGGLTVEVEPYPDVIEEDEDYLRETGRDLYADDIREDKLTELGGDISSELREEYYDAFPDTTESLTDHVGRVLESLLIDRLVPQEGSPEWRFVVERVSLPGGFEEEIEDLATDAAREAYYEDPVYQYAVGITLPDGSYEIESVEGRAGDGDYTWRGDFYHSLGSAVDAIREDYEEEYGTGDGDAVKWEQFTEDGGVDYREVLLTVEDLDVTGPNAWRGTGAYADPNHGDDPNTIVRTRLNFREAADGSKVLFVEEVQADLSSAWRERGGQPELGPLRAAQREHERLYGELQATRDEADKAAEAALTALVGAETASTFRLGTGAATGVLRAAGDVAREAGKSKEALADLEGEAQYTQVPFPYGDATRTSFLEVARALAKAENGEPNETSETALRAHFYMQGQLRDVSQRMMDAREALRSTASLPFSPYDSDTYSTLGIKKMLRLAAEEGADKLAWTPAYMQARRWSGAVQNVVQEITWEDNGTLNWVGEDGATGPAREVVLSGVNGEDAFLVDADGVIREKSRRGGRIEESDVVGKTLSELLSPALAKQIMESPRGNLAGQQIVVGGEGFENVYDRQIRKFVEKFAKKYGSRVVLDKTMPDFVKGTGVDPYERALRDASDEEIGAFFVAMREKEAFDTFYSNYAERVAAARADELERIEENEAAIAGVEERLSTLRPRPQPDEDGWLSVEAEAAYRDSEDAEQRGMLEAKMARLVEMTNERRERLRQFDNPPTVQRDALRTAYRSNVVTEADLRASLEVRQPEGDPVWSVDITPELRAAALEAQPLFQRRPDGARGSVLLPTEPGRAPLVTFYPKADLSTFLHESAHYYLHILQRIAASGEAPEGMRADWERIREWWGSRTAEIAKDGGVSEDAVINYLRDGTTGDVEIDRAVNVGLQEQWARAYEAYLLEGKAPSNALRSAFEAFSAWLLSVYRRARSMDVEINDELRGVFDRLLATDEEIAQAAADQGFDQLVAPNAEALGITEEEYRYLVRLSGEAQDEAKQRLLKDIMAPIRAARTKEMRAVKEAVREQIAEEVHAKKANRVREWLGNERWVGADEDNPNPQRLPLDLRISRQSVIDDYGQDMLDALPRGARPLTTTETALTADDVAGWFGYRSGSEMLQDVAATPSPTREIAARTDAEMRRRYPTDPVTDGTVEAAAVSALHGEKRGMLIAAELKALSAQGRRGKTTTRSQAAEIARKTIQRMPVQKAVRSSAYLAVERRAGERAALAVARGDFEAAYEAKREQLINHQLYVESRKASDMLGKVERRVARLKKKSTRKNLAGEYLEAIDDILTSYDFRKSVTQRAARRRAGLAAYVDMMTEAGRENELAIPAYVLDEARRRPYRTLPVGELQGVLDSLRNIEHTARMKQKLRDAQDERNFTAVVESITEEMDANLTDGAPNRVATEGEKRKRGVREFMNLLLNADSILRKIGGFERGAAYEALKAPIDAAADWATNERERAATAFEELYSVYSTREQRQMAVRRHHTALNGAFTQWDLISAALNMGNADNLSRLMDKDSGQGFNAAQVAYIKKQLSERDWQFVQGSWDLINNYWPMIEAREKRLTGVAPKKVQALEVETPYGNLPGGYYPIKYRGDVSGLVAAEEIIDVQKQMLAGKFAKAQTRSGHLIERAQGSGGRVLQLGVEVMHQHVGQVIHDLAFSEAVTNGARLLRDVRVRTKFEQKGLLADHQALELWLQDVATGQLAAGGVFGRLALRAKSGFTLSKLAFNLSTVAIQLTGVTQSVVTVGAKNLAKGYSTYLSAPGRTTNELIEASPFMRERETTFNRDINDVLNEVSVGPTTSQFNNAQRLIAKYGFWLMQKVQFYGVDVPTWYGGYYQGLDKFNGDETKARKHADRMVARAQASGVFSDRSAFERGTLDHGTRQNGFVRLFTTLGSYMFAKGNLAYEVYGRTARDVDGVNQKSLIAALRGATDMLLLFTVEAIAYNFVKGTLPDDEDDDDAGWAEFLIKETALSMMSTIPGIRDLGSSLAGFEGGAYGSIISTFSRPAIQAAQGEADIPLLKAALSAVGVATGMPSGQLNRVVDAWYRLEQGDDVAPVEFIMGRR